MKRGRLLGALALVPLLSLIVMESVAQVKEKPQRDAVQKLMKDGNWKEAYDGFSRLALDPADDPLLVGQDLTNAVQCLRNVNRHI